MNSERRILGLGSGVGIVVANMIGAGVFLSAGFMAQDLGPGAILLAWVVGAVLALSGTLAYAGVARLVPRSGGEYRYLSALLHPALGYLAGWASLLLGFSAPIAVDAFAAGAFVHTLYEGVDVRAVGVAVIAVLTLLHAAGLKPSRATQNGLVIVKGILLLGFVVVGLALGSHQWPTWTPPHASAGFPFGPFVNSLFFIAFAFSGWNAAIYAAEEFKSPETDVPRSMIIGCAIVAIVYLLVNWVFVANLTPQEAQAVFKYESSRITLGHLVMADLLGPVGGRVMSVLAVVALVSSMSAMTFVGPRVYAAMAEDGFLPRALVGAPGTPPRWSVVLQGGLAVALLYCYELVQVILQNVGALLTLFAGLTALGLFRWRRVAENRSGAPGLGRLAAAGIYASSAVFMLYVGFRGATPDLVRWLTGVAVIALAAYGLTRQIRRG
jgi:APA family basic amino acid/polyamine antiporter